MLLYCISFKHTWTLNIYYTLEGINQRPSLTIIVMKSEWIFSDYRWMKKEWRKLSGLTQRFSNRALKGEMVLVKDVYVNVEASPIRDNVH